MLLPLGYTSGVQGPFFYYWVIRVKIVREACCCCRDRHITAIYINKICDIVPYRCMTKTSPNRITNCWNNAPFFVAEVILLDC